MSKLILIIVIILSLTFSLFHYFSWYQRSQANNPQEKNYVNAIENIDKNKEDGNKCVHAKDDDNTDLKNIIGSEVLDKIKFEEQQKIMNDRDNNLGSHIELSGTELHEFSEEESIFIALAQNELEKRQIPKERKPFVTFDESIATVTFEPPLHARAGAWVLKFDRQTKILIDVKIWR